MNRLQEESIGRGAVGAATVREACGLIEEGDEGGEIASPLGHLNRGSGEEPHHFVEESIARESETKAIVDRLEACLRKCAVVIGGLGFIASSGAEALEVVVADEGV